MVISQVPIQSALQKGEEVFVTTELKDVEGVEGNKFPPVKGYETEVSVLATWAS